MAPAVLTEGAARVIRYLPLAWCPVTGVWLALDLMAWRMVDLKG